MARMRINQHLGASRLSSIRDRALWLARMNECMARQLPLSINTEVTLVNVDTRQRAVLHVAGGEWATQIRMHQRMIMAVLASCGVEGVRSVLVKSRPASLKSLMPRTPTRPKREISAATREMVETTAESIKDEKLRESLRRLARKSV